MRKVQLAISSYVTAVESKRRPVTMEKDEEILTLEEKGSKLSLFSFIRKIK